MVYALSLIYIFRADYGLLSLSERYRICSICITVFLYLFLSIPSVDIKFRIEGVKVLAVQLLLCNSKHLAEMINLSKPQFSA